MYSRQERELSYGAAGDIGKLSIGNSQNHSESSVEILHLERRMMVYREERDKNINLIVDQSVVERMCS